jgi:hypothetical protein
VQAHAARYASPIEGLHVRIGAVGIYPTNRCYDVLPRPQNGFDLVVVGNQRRVHHAVRVQRQHFVFVRAGHDTQRLPSQNLTDVAAVLVGAVHPTADKF